MCGIYSGDQEIEPIGSIFVISYPNYQWIGFVGKIETEKPHVFHGKNNGFRLKLSQQNQSIEIIEKYGSD